MNSSKKTSILHTSDAVRRWHNKQNQKHFQKIASSPNKWPLPKTHKCVNDDDIKGKLFCIQQQKYDLDVSFELFNVPAAGYPGFGMQAGTLPTQKYSYTAEQEITENLYYFDRNDGRMGIRKITISSKEHVIATGLKTITAISDGNDPEYYEVLTTRGVAFILKEKLRLVV